MHECQVITQGIVLGLIPCPHINILDPYFKTPSTVVSSDKQGTFYIILSSQVVSLPFQSANFCAAMDTLIDQDGFI